jgi:hypothetical protein
MVVSTATFLIVSRYFIINHLVCAFSPGFMTVDCHQFHSAAVDDSLMML